MKKAKNKKLTGIIIILLFLGLIGSCNSDEDKDKVTSSNDTTTLVDSYSEESDSNNEENISTTEITPEPESNNNTISDENTSFDISSIPPYNGKSFVVLNDNNPTFNSEELTTVGYEKYSPLDSLGRCQTAIASVGTDTMPKDGDKRGSISNIYPSGWNQAKYNGISGGYLWNRCHLIGWQLSAENANTSNLITGTRYLNIEGMLPFENMVADYINEKNNHVAYRVSPIYEGNNLVCSGVHMEGFSVEDNGSGICFNVYCYNVQPGIDIDYLNGSSSSNTTEQMQTQETDSSTQAVQPESNGDIVWISQSGSKYHSNASCSNMKNPQKVTKEEAISRGYQPCKKCY